ncbi:CPBP family intramembrane metalloprotease [Arthrobacter sp. D1-29]
MATQRRRPPPPQPELYRFSGLDFTTVGLYVGLAAFIALAGQLLLPLLRQLGPSRLAASYGLTFVYFATVAVLALLAARRVVARDLRVLATRPWFTLFIVPATVVAMLIFTSLVAAAVGGTETSENEAVFKELMQRFPIWVTAPLVVVIVPFVEEYLFRHLLIGKLSRRVNIWLCSVVSAVLFAVLHMVGQDAITVAVLLPYLAAGSVLVLVYLWTGKNLMFAYFVHAANNLLALVIAYAIPPEVYEQIQQVQP